MSSRKSVRFSSRTPDDFSSQLTHRNTSRDYDEENTASVPTGRSSRWPQWFRADGAAKVGPKMQRSITTMDEENEKRVGHKSKKLGTFSGVFVPTSLNVLSILMFIRFGFILGQAGILGTEGMLVVSYLICLITTLSISAISSNGTVRGGGAYYLISRSLGPEFGGSIGFVFYLGCVFNTGLNAVGLVDCLVNTYGQGIGSASPLLPASFWWRYLYATLVLVLCTIICLLGSSIFAKASNLLLVVLLVATFSIPISTLLVQPFYDPSLDISYTGPSLKTLRQNLLPHFTNGAAGSASSGPENWQSQFGLLFPATSGIFAGASMSGDLQRPSKSIPKGTLQGLAFTFVTYTIVILSMGASIPRDSMYRDANIIQDVNASSALILMGEFATSFFSVLMGVIGSAKSMQALARDNVLPGFSFFGQGTKSADEPIYAILFTYVLSQLTLLLDINQIANFITMTYLMTFLVTNLACFLLKIGSAPNFRPSFRYFTWWTAAFGAVMSLLTMFFVDGIYATGCLGLLIVLFVVIHYTTPPKSWGDVSQSLIYHQVRKYLLRLKQEHVKFWRPQILLFVNDPRHSWKLIQFCNAMKKGALYILGHIIVAPDFEDAFPEVKRQQAAWMKYIDFSKIKAFVQVSVAPAVEWGARNIVLSAGLGGMRPNIAVLGFYNMKEYRNSRPLVDAPPPPSTATSSRSSVKALFVGNDEPPEQLPTDTNRPEKAVTPQGYVTILEDLLLRLQINVTIARGFSELELPQKGVKPQKKYIDLWPIQMSAEIEGDTGTNSNILTTNFDTYTLILQLGCILHTVPAWKKTYSLRAIVFVEHESDVEEERQRVARLLENLRIQAEVIVTWLASGELHTYGVIVKGNPPKSGEVDSVLGQEEWWKKLQKRRAKPTAASSINDIGRLITRNEWPSSSFQHGPGQDPVTSRLRGLTRIFKTRKNRHMMSGLHRMGLSVSLSMRTHRLRTDGFGCSSGSSEPSSEESSSDSAASENDLVEFTDEEADQVTRTQKIRRASTGDALSYGHRPRRTSLLGPSALPMEGGSIADTATGTGESDLANRLKALAEPTRPKAIRAPSFSSKAIPETQISTEEGGRSISFATPLPTACTPGSAANTSNIKTGVGPSISPAQPQLVSLSFNDLPARAQHLILNELMKKYSDQTAVIFTTLPLPLAGTHKSEKDSMDYLSALEVFTDGLPPTLLIHSNSLTVTTAL